MITFFIIGLISGYIAAKRYTQKMAS
jgi:hypothetical protein